MRIPSKESSGRKNSLLCGSREIFQRFEIVKVLKEIISNIDHKLQKRAKERIKRGGHDIAIF